jgi:type VI secretion system protein ImpF
VQAKQRLSPPLKQVFRAAYAARDAKLKLDVRDEAGERIIAGRRANARLAITEQVLKREVSLDLEMLMNTIAFEATSDLSTAPLVRRSILNYGLPDIGSRTIDEASVGLIKDEIRAALVVYEPRLAPGSIVVERDAAVDDTLRIRFLVRADLLCDPVAVPVEFVADIDTETNTFSVLSA